MKAVVCTGPLPATDSSVFADTELSDPVALDHDLLVRVHAVSVNPIDTKVRMMPLQPAADGAAAPRVLGWDAAGVVEAVGSSVTRFAPGDKVYYAGNVQRPGSNSQLQLVDGRIVGSMPASLSFAHAAALPLTALTAFEGLFEHMFIGGSVFGLPQSGPAAQNLLVIGGAGGVGSLAIQLARLVPGLTVVATASRDESRSWCERLGAHHVVDHHGDLVAQCQALDIARFDHIFLTRDPDGYFEAAAKLCAAHGKICSIVDASGSLPIMKLRNKGASFCWEAMFARSNFQADDMGRQGEILDVVARWADEGRIVTTYTTDFGAMNAANLRAAHSAVEAGSMIGKGVLTWIDD